LLENGKSVTQYLTLIPANVDPGLGIEARSFDTAIEEINRIREAIVRGDD